MCLNSHNFSGNNRELEKAPLRLIFFNFKLRFSSTSSSISKTHTGVGNIWQYIPPSSHRDLQSPTLLFPSLSYPLHLPPPLFSPAILSPLLPPAPLLFLEAVVSTMITA